MDLRKRLFLMIGGVLLVLLLIFGAIYWFSKSKTAAPEGETQTTSTIPSSNTTQNTPGPTLAPFDIEKTLPKTPEEQEQLYIRQTVRDFTERFLSYSNQNDNQHIADVVSLATPSVRTWIEKQKITMSAVYSGVTTKVISTSIISKDGDVASVKIGVQQINESTTSTETIYKNGHVDVEKSGKNWLISGIFFDK